ncbi:MAG: uL15m family ribosomal protein [Candidatus Thermoplasmatota archaeon]
MPSRTSRFRGSRTHGRGKKAGRGAGKRGGRGLAGLHKHKVMQMIKYMPDHFGMHGFVRHGVSIERGREMNLGALGEAIPRLIAEGLAKDVEGAVEVDLGALGVRKLLGAGRITQALRITVSMASKRAVEKVEAAGGAVKILEGETEKSE